MTTVVKIAIGVVVGAGLFAAGIFTGKKLEIEELKKLVAAAEAKEANQYCADDEVPTVEGWENCRPAEGL